MRLKQCRANQNYHCLKCLSLPHGFLAGCCFHPSSLTSSTAGHSRRATGGGTKVAPSHFRVSYPVPALLTLCWLAGCPPRDPDVSPEQLVATHSGSFPPAPLGSTPVPGAAAGGGSKSPRQPRKRPYWYSHPKGWEQPGSLLLCSPAEGRGARSQQRLQALCNWEEEGIEEGSKLHFPEKFSSKYSSAADKSPVSMT